MPQTIKNVPPTIFSEDPSDAEKVGTFVDRLDVFARHGEIAHQFMIDMFEICSDKEQ